MSTRTATPVIALAAVLAGVVGGAAGALLVRPAPSDAPAQAPLDTPAPTAALHERLDELERRLRAQRRTAAAGDPQRRAAAPTDAELEARIADQVAAELDRRERASGDDDASADFDPDQAVVDLLAASEDGDRAAIWAAARQADAVDELVEAFERRAAQHPHSPDARVDLGLAYVQKLLSATDAATRMELGKQADAAFSRALELDPQHWGARFRKAEGLAHWPAASGKHQEAIGHFETLIEQQTGRAPRPQFAATYRYLANLYAQRGRVADARAMLQRGLSRHPDDRSLRDALRGIGDN